MKVSPRKSQTETGDVESEKLGKKPGNITKKGHVGPAWEARQLTRRRRGRTDERAAKQLKESNWLENKKETHANGRAKIKNKKQKHAEPGTTFSTKNRPKDSAPSGPSKVFRKRIQQQQKTVPIHSTDNSMGLHGIFAIIGDIIRVKPPISP